MTTWTTCTTATGTPHTKGTTTSTDQPAWTRLTAAVPWLADLDPTVTRRLDLTELVEPAGEVATVRAEVERAVDAYVMTYRSRPPAPAGRQLCQVLQPASLDDTAVEALRAAEERLRPAGVLLCAYARPLRYRS